MRSSTPPEFRSEALLARADFGRIDAILRREALARGLDLHEGHGRSTWCETEQGEYGAKKRGENVLVFARAHRSDWLPLMQEALAGQLLREMPETAGGLRWSSAADAGKLPANFSFAEVGGIERIGRDFLRMRLDGPDLGRFSARDSIHFRLVLPRPGDGAPEWPRMGTNGQVLWPAGEKSLHRPVYTVHRVDSTAGWLETDIFLHSGGRVSDWAGGNPKGQRVGLMGPSGGGIPEAAELLLAGDETAYPAIARILSARPEAQGRVYLLGEGAD